MEGDVKIINLKQNVVMGSLPPQQQSRIAFWFRPQALHRKLKRQQLKLESIREAIRVSCCKLWHRACMRRSRVHVDANLVRSSALRNFNIQRCPCDLDGRASKVISKSFRSKVVPRWVRAFGPCEKVEMDVNFWKFLVLQLAITKTQFFCFFQARPPSMGL